jgi:hypothetical protein
MHQVSIIVCTNGQKNRNLLACGTHRLGNDSLVRFPGLGSDRHTAVAIGLH